MEGDLVLVTEQDLTFDWFTVNLDCSKSAAVLPSSLDCQLPISGHQPITFSLHAHGARRRCCGDCSCGALVVGTRLLARLGALSSRDPPFYNLMAGVLLLVATRLYCCAENPCTPAVVFIIAARMLFKSQRWHDALLGVTLLLDGLTGAMAACWALAPASTTSSPCLRRRWRRRMSSCRLRVKG